jgi:signal transduction histidine kinase
VSPQRDMGQGDMPETTEQRKRYIPTFRTRLFYTWSFILILAPVLTQILIYAVLCSTCGFCMEGSRPWIILALLFIPGSSLMHWILSRVIREETGELRAVVEESGNQPLREKRLKGFYAFPRKIFEVSLPIGVVFLFPLTFSCIGRFEPAATWSLVFLPLAAYLLLAAVFSTVGSRAVGRIGQFIPPIKTPSVITGRLSGSLALAAFMVVGGFIFAACPLAALGFTTGSEGGGAFPALLLLCALVTAACVTAAWYLGRIMGRDLQRISSHFMSLFALESDKTISGIKVTAPPHVIVSDIGDLWSLTQVVMTRISEMRRIRAEAIEGMVQNQKMKTLFLASMSHDLKSPLNSIIGFSELLIKGIEGELNEEQREDIQLIHNSGEELLSLINNIMDYARLEAGTLEIHKEWTPSVELVTSAVKGGGHLVGGKDIGIQTEIQPGLPPVFVDPARISQVLSSLISNAVKFMEKGIITVKAFQARGLFEESDKYLRIDVVDTGMGIKQADIEKIFDSFKQLDSSFSRRSSGLGLGLSLARELIDLHNGRIWVESEIGRGSIFSIGLTMDRID